MSRQFNEAERHDLRNLGVDDARISRLELILPYVERMVRGGNLWDQDTRAAFDRVAAAVETLARASTAEPGSPESSVWSRLVFASMNDVSTRPMALLAAMLPEVQGLVAEAARSRPLKGEQHRRSANPLVVEYILNALSIDDAGPAAGPPQVSRFASMARQLLGDPPLSDDAHDVSELAAPSRVGRSNPFRRVWDITVKAATGQTAPDPGRYIKEWNGGAGVRGVLPHAARTHKLAVNKAAKRKLQK